MKRDMFLISVEALHIIVSSFLLVSLSGLSVCTRTRSVSVLSPAVEDYQEAREFDQENQEIREGLERAQKLLKISRKRDYYKILGVSRYGHKQAF